MSFDTIKRSAADGRPIDLYTFSRGSGFVWRFTSADRDLTAETQIYRAAVIQRGKIEQGSEAQRSNLKLTVPRDFQIAELYKIAPPSDAINLVLRQYHYGDTEIKTLWQGEITAVSFGPDDAEIELQPFSGNLRSTGLRRNYQKSCPFVLYGPDCTVNPAAVRTTGTAAVIVGSVITVNEADPLADGFFDGGYIEWLVAPGTYDRRFIVSHVNAAITVDVTPLGLAVGQEVRLYPGCDHSIATCQGKFSNALNFGGMPYIPTKNPFGSDPVY